MERLTTRLLEFGQDRRIWVFLFERHGHTWLPNIRTQRDRRRLIQRSDYSSVRRRCGLSGRAGDCQTASAACSQFGRV